MQASSSAHSQGSPQTVAGPASSQGAGQDSVLGKRKGAPGLSRPTDQTGMHPQAAQTAADPMRIWNCARESRAAPPAARGSQEPSGHMNGASADVCLPDSEQEGESTAPVPKRQRRGSGGEQARAAADGCPEVAEQEPSVPGQAAPGAAGPRRPRRARTAAAMAASETKRRLSAAGSASAAAAGGAGRLAPADRLPSPGGPQQQGSGAKAEADVAWQHRREQPAQVRSGGRRSHWTVTRLHNRLDYMYAVFCLAKDTLALLPQEKRTRFLSRNGLFCMVLCPFV